MGREGGRCGGREVYSRMRSKVNSLHCTIYRSGARMFRLSFTSMNSWTREGGAEEWGVGGERGKEGGSE